MSQDFNDTENVLLQKILRAINAGALQAVEPGPGPGPVDDSGFPPGTDIDFSVDGPGQTPVITVTFNDVVIGSWFVLGGVVRSCSYAGV